MELSDSMLKLIRPLLHGDLIGNVVFVVTIVLAALVLMGVYKLVTRLAGIGGKPHPMEEGEETETEEKGEDEPPEESREDGSAEQEGEQLEESDSEEQ